MPMNKPNIPFLTEGGITTLRDIPEISNLMARSQLTLPFDFPNTGDPFKDNYYDQQGNYIGPTVTG